MATGNYGAMANIKTNQRKNPFEAALTDEELLQRDLTKAIVSEIKPLLKKRGLDSSGKKDDLVGRLKRYIEANDAGKRRLKRSGNGT